MRALNYFLAEAGASLWRGRRASALAVATIAAGLFVLGLFLLLGANVRQLVERWGSAAEMSVYLSDGASAEQVAAVRRTIEESPAVSGNRYVSKADAFERFRRDFPELAAAAAGTTTNPFPASFDVLLRPEAAGGGAIEALAGTLGGLPGVEDVRYDRRWLDRLLTAVVLINGLGLVMVAVLVVAAALTVANVVRLTAYGRRDEIEIMDLVGAPAAYVRGPFVMEGTLQGGLGAVAAIGALWAGHLAARALYGDVAGEALGMDALAFLPWSISALLIAGGMAVGCAGGWIGARAVR